jgi:hypothetical protein
MLYRYKVDSEKYELPNFIRNRAENRDEPVCNADSIRGAMKAGAVYVFSYSDINSKSLGRFVVMPADPQARKRGACEAGPLGRATSG